MGAINAMAAFDTYAGLVPPTSLLVLIRMALVSKDSDREPWFSEGHKALARAALGRGRHAEVDETDLKAVQRAMRPLHEVGAITTDRPASVRRDDGSTARYLLHLKTPHGGRKPSGVEAPSRGTKNGGRHRTEDPQRGTVSGLHGGRKTVARGTETVHQRKQEETRRRQEELEARDRTAIAAVLRHPSAELAIIEPAQPPAVVVNAGSITAGWIDHCKTSGVALPRDLIGRYAKAINQALEDGFDPNLIKRALGRMLDDGQASWPGSFGAYLVRVQEAPTGRTRKLTPGEESAARLVGGADNPGEVIDAVQRFFERGAS